MKKKSICLFGHRTSITLEEQFWDALREISIKKDLSVQKLVEHIDEKRAHKNLSAAIRIYILSFYQKTMSSIE
jgi:predicted DNA-binding ribbon-helix-helix protein